MIITAQPFISIMTLGVISKRPYTVNIYAISVL